MPPRFGTTLRSERAAFRVDLVAGGLSHPWAIDVLPDGALIVTERRGAMRVITTSGNVSQPLRGVPKVQAKGQGGLLDVALHPAFAENSLVYFSYSEPGPGGAATAVARARLAADRTSLSDFELIFSQKPRLPGSYHFGSRIVFDGAGHIFVGLGERFAERTRVKAQELDTHLGKIVRLNEDGSVPDDNPFVGTPEALPEIWSLGHRNIQAMAIEPESGALWEIEHGPMGGDELNIVRPRANYGWPVVSFGLNYDGTPVGTGKSSAPGFVPPVRQWTPVIAPSGMAFYEGDAFPGWKGSLFAGGLATTCLVRLEHDGETIIHEERMLREFGFRIREVVAAPDGSILVATDEESGHVLRLVPA